MSGHSKWSTIKRQKGVTDAKKGVLFTKLGHTIAIAARSGTDPEMNFALRLAMDKARAANMPLVNIQRSIDRGSSKLGGAQIVEVLYEGYGPEGVAILVECSTDNLNRTYPEVRLAFTKHGGRIAEKGSVAFNFNHKGQIRISAKSEEMMLMAIEAGADDVEEEADDTLIYTDPKRLAEVRDKLKAQGLGIVEADLTFVPIDMVKISDPIVAEKIIRLMDALDELDDVSAVYANFDIPEDLLDKQ